MMKFNLIVVLMQLIRSKLSIDTIRKSVDQIKTEFKSDIVENTIINPIYGWLFEATGAVHNIRFYGPKPIINMEDHKRNHSKDKSKDTVVKSVIEMFPSIDGQLSCIRGTRENLGKILREYKKDGVIFLGQIFSELLLEKIVENNIINNSDKNEQANDQKKQRRRKHNESKQIDPTQVTGQTNNQDSQNKGTGDLKDIDSNQRLIKFKNNIKSKDNTVFQDKTVKLMLIHSFSLNIFETEEELSLYLGTIMKNVEVNLKKDRANGETFEIDTFKTSYNVIDETSNLFNLQNVFPYTIINKPPSNIRIPYYNRATKSFESSKLFTDCVEITILNICNCLFYDSKKRCYNIRKLNPKSDIYKFYEKNNTILHLSPFLQIEKPR